MTLIWSSREPGVQIAALISLLVFALAALAALVTGHSPAAAAQLAALAYAATAAVALWRFGTSPLLVLLASVQITAVLLSAPIRKARSAR